MIILTIVAPFRAPKIEMDRAPIPFECAFTSEKYNAVFSTYFIMINVVL